MYDETAERKPFDVSTISDALETEIHTPAPRRDRKPSSLTLRRLVGGVDSAGIEPASGDATPMDTPTGPTDASETLLTERQHIHGDFADNARVSQSLKRIFRDEPGWGLLTDVERESMDMIALKFSRILSGKSLELQHWEDVVGYAKLAEKQCQPVT